MTRSVETLAGCIPAKRILFSVTTFFALAPQGGYRALRSFRLSGPLFGRPTGPDCARQLRNAVRGTGIALAENGIFIAVMLCLSHDARRWRATA